MMKLTIHFLDKDQDVTNQECDKRWSNMKELVTTLDNDEIPVSNTIPLPIPILIPDPPQEVIVLDDEKPLSSDERFVQEVIQEMAEVPVLNPAPNPNPTTSPEVIVLEEENTISSDERFIQEVIQDIVEDPLNISLPKCNTDDDSDITSPESNSDDNPLMGIPKLSPVRVHHTKSTPSVLGPSTNKREICGCYFFDTDCQKRTGVPCKRHANEIQRKNRIQVQAPQPPPIVEQHQEVTLYGSEEEVAESATSEDIPDNVEKDPDYDYSNLKLPGNRTAVNSSKTRPKRQRKK